MFSENVTSADNQQERLDKDKLGYFLAGFVEGEGSFNVSLRKKNDYKLQWQVVLSFNVSQKDLTLLHLLKKKLDCGIIKVRKRDLVYSLDITKPKDVIEKVIPYFKTYHFISSSKKRNFSIFCEIAQMIKENKHLDVEGLKEIVQLREILNEGKGRKRKHSISDVFPSQESSQTIRQTSNILGEDIVASAWRHAVTNSEGNLS
ncbi:hypothetical protein A3D91_03260 [candidate division WWE3 bacterium RIFCSPHIGHO2_02_FULL_38_14]|uniref:Homing endonuclease LAGLIDADG domain-containing protein n=1 Tax=candidate division WWE3 bacterium RIFCSPHIGHO2_02_FULL_38_14 TaxID=1802620 RepID=A0A1F4V6W5_UNCKA|nr:MAG: hypothetical protein A3D91_03260 [candidate division WWE3 bacterium RIFCSPHIGHO2_02_FULL_38_14]